MYAQVIHRLIDAIPGMDPNHRAELHERVGEETAAAMNAAPQQEPPAVAPVVADTPPEEPPATVQLV